MHYTDHYIVCARHALLPSCTCRPQMNNFGCRTTYLRACTLIYELLGAPSGCNTALGKKVSPDLVKRYDVEVLRQTSTGFDLSARR